MKQFAKGDRVFYDFEGSRITGTVARKPYGEFPATVTIQQDNDGKRVRVDIRAIRRLNVQSN